MMSAFLAEPTPQRLLFSCGGMLLLLNLVHAFVCYVRTKHHLKPSRLGGFPVLPPLSDRRLEPDSSAQGLITSHRLWITMVFSGELFILLLLNYIPFQRSYCCFPFVNYGFSTLLYLSMTQRGDYGNIRTCSIEF